MTVADEVTGLAKVRNRRLFIEDRREFDAKIARIDEQWQLEVIVRRLLAARNARQNRWYWSQVVGLTAKHTGYTADEMHDIFKMKFIPKRLAICDGNGEVFDEYVLGGSTRKMTTKDFAEYCDAIRQWAAETLDVDIPDPDPDWRSAETSHGWGV